MGHDPRETVGNGTEDSIAGLPQSLEKRKNVQIPTNFLGGTVESVGFIPLCLVFYVKVEVRMVLRVEGCFLEIYPYTSSKHFLEGSNLDRQECSPWPFPYFPLPNLLLLHYNLPSQLGGEKKKSRIEKERRRIWL